jgi:hypothetical protein
MTVKTATTTVVEVGHGTQEYLMKYDIPTRIAAGLKKLGDRWIHEPDLVRLCGLNPQQFTPHSKGFKEFIVREPQGERDKRVWAGTKAYAAKLRGGSNNG